MVESAPVIVLRTRGPLPTGLRRRFDTQGRVRYKIDLKSLWIPGGRYARWIGAVSRDEAEAKLREVQDLIRRARLGLPPKHPASALQSFAEVAEMYVNELRDLNRRERAVETAAGHVRLLGRYLGHRPVSAVTAEEIEAMRSGLLHPKEPGAVARSGRTVKNYLDTLHAVFEYAIRHRYIRWNPVGAVARPSVEPREEGFWNLHPRDDARLVAACRPAWAACAVSIGLYVGLRETPIVSLKVDDIDIENRAIRVSGKTNKGRRGRGRKTEWKPIPARVLPFLKAQVAEAKAAASPWLFPSPVDPQKSIGRNMLYRAFKRAAKRAGLGASARFHDLRHICNTRIKAAGLADLMDRAERSAREALGHDSIEASAIYTHYDADKLRPVYDRLEAWLDERQGAAG